MIQCLFVRHGDAHLNPADHDKHLTDLGQKAMHRMGKSLKGLNEKPEMIVASPLSRARETAIILQDHLGGELEEFDGLAPGAYVESLINMMREQPEVKYWAFVGHAPDMGQIASELLGLPVDLDFKKGATLKLAMAEPSVGAAHLTYFLHPALLLE